ncbi:MAG TPA: GAF domain-containing protein, partial [Candidatus Polarisedimenticolaceae bacterium]|nr:GAF domain-containing protein [Candidatus Polarisedimenticolaceae bacterium]
MDASTLEVGRVTDPGTLDSADRLQALRRTGLLDSPPEEAFDRLTRLASFLLRVPVACVVLTDERRHFFKSQVGLPEPLARARETPLSHSFCKRAVESRKPILVTDERVDSDLQQNPAVAEHGLVAYAGIPLINVDGHALGTFCVLDGTPHAWTEEEVGVLRELARSAISEIELRQVAGELRTLSTRLQATVESRTVELRRTQERQRVLLEVNNAVVTCLDRGSLFQAAVAALGRAIPFDRAALVLHDPARDVFTVLGAADPALTPPVLPLRREFPRQGSRSGWVFDHGRALLTTDMREPPSFVEHAFLLEEGIRSAVTVPLTVKGKAMGTLNVVSRTVGRYDEEDASLLLAIGEQMALAIENLLAYEEIAALRARVEEEKLYLQEEARTESAFGDVVGESPGILQVLAGVRKVADTDSTVLVTGETGTGKELIVRAI